MQSATEISRIVDPSYIGKSSPYSAPFHLPSPGLHHQPTAYVDEHGCMHDPDYRDFPTLPLRSSRRVSSSKRHSAHGYVEPYENDDDVVAGARWLAERTSRRNSASERPEEPVNFYHRASFEESFIFEDEPETPVSPTEFKASGQSSPTSHGLRYQLHAIQLDLCLKVVRAKRRWREQRSAATSPR